MYNVEDAASIGTTNGEVNQPPELENPPVMTAAERVEDSMAQFLENRVAFMQWKTQQQIGEATNNVLDCFRRLCPTEFDGTVSPTVAKEWLRGVQRFFFDYGCG